MTIPAAYFAMGHGPDVVFAHGIGEDHTTWSTIQRSLAEVCRSYAYDIRGHADTPLGDADGTLAQLGGDLADMAMSIGAGPKVVVGFSLGGTIALWIAAHRPDLVRGAVAIATSSIVGSRAAAGYRESIELFSSGKRDEIEASLRQHLRDGLWRADFDVEPILAANLAAIGDGRGYCNASAAMARVHEEPLTPLLPTIECPVLVVGGEHDTYCPRKAQQLILEGLRYGTYAEIADSGHLVLDEAPQQVSEHISRFVSSLPG